MMISMALWAGKMTFTSFSACNTKSYSTECIQKTKAMFIIYLNSLLAYSITKALSGHNVFINMHKSHINIRYTLVPWIKLSFPVFSQTVTLQHLSNIKTDTNFFSQPFLISWLSHSGRLIHSTLLGLFMHLL